MDMSDTDASSNTTQGAVYNDPEASEERKIGGTLFITAESQGPPFYILPDTLRAWPYERILNPYYHLVTAESVEWLSDFRRIMLLGKKSHNKSASGLICALTAPYASREVLRSYCDFMHTCYMLEEYTDPLPMAQAAEVCEASMDAIVHPDKCRPKGEPIVGEITRQFWQRFSALATQATQERFIRVWRSFLDSFILQAKRRDKDRYICSVDEYMASRQDNIGSKPCFVFMELSLGLDIPQHVLDHPSIEALAKDVNTMIMLANDMCSYKKEVLANAADYNAITVVMHQYNTDIAGGIQWISDTHDEVSQHFLQVRNDVLNKRGFPSFGEALDRQIESYIDGLGQWVRGNDEWHFGTERYFGKEGPEIQKTRKVFMH